MSQTLVDPLVSLTSVSFQYPHLSGERGGVHDITFCVRRGDRVVLVGPNGSGKSTLLSLVAGQRKALSGHVDVLGTDAFNNTRLQQSVMLIGQPWPAEAFFSTTVDRLTSPAPIKERREKIAAALNISLRHSVSRMSFGERRRVQILHGMVQPSVVHLLDECSTDIDVAERKTVLELVKAECSANNGCCLYATHILDDIDDWATHVLLMQQGSVVDFKKLSDIQEPLEVFVRKFLMKHHQRHLKLFALGCPKREEDEEETPPFGGFKGRDDYDHCDAVIYGTGSFPNEKEVVIVCEQLCYKEIFSNLSFKVYRGERVLLCGCNGTGKSTLLNMMGGKQFFNNNLRSLCILDKTCYDDMTLNGLVALAGDWWTSTPPGEMHVYELLQLNTPRARRLCEFLEVDLSWDVRHISAGERKRVQLLLHLLEDKPIVLLDEATSDLDLDQRHELLSFLYDESVYRGVTVVYATHIFGGLGNWPTTVMMLDRTKRGLCGLWRGGDVDWAWVTSELIALKEKERGG